MNCRINHRRVKRWGALAVAGSMLLQSALPAYATVSQVPGLYSAPPDSNVMLTLDDSSSMEDETIPDDYDGIGHSMWSANWASSTMGNTFKLQAQTWRYYRSSSGNPIYYNPDVYYKPWPYAGDDKQTYPPAIPTAACYYAVNLPFALTPPYPAGAPTTIACGSKVRNLASRVVTNSPDDTAQNDDTKGYWPATYFRYVGTVPLSAMGKADTSGNGTSANWQKIEIRPNVLIYPPKHSSDPVQPPKGPRRIDCLGDTCTYDEEIKNFANWFQYYRSRALMAKGAAAQAFAIQGNGLRVGFATLHGSSTMIDGANTPLIKRGVRKFESAARWEFYAKLYASGTLDGTALRYAADVIGKYFSRSGPGNPWSEDPSNTASVGNEAQLSCRRSFHLLTSDGYWNTIADPSGGVPSVGNADDFTSLVAPAWPDGKLGAPDPAVFAVNPFKDGNSNTLSDYAAYYWRRDLRGDLPNNVFTSTRDPAYWQHLTTYTIGMGLTNGTAAVTTQTQRDQAIAAKTAIAWPDPNNGDLAKGDDFVHASMSGHGKSFTAADPTTLASNLAEALAEASDKPGSLANLATQSGQVSAGSAVYQATYNPSRWSGRLYAFAQAASGAVDTSKPDQAIWEASRQLPPPSERNIFSWNPSSGTGSLFSWSDSTNGLTPAQRTSLGSQDVYNFIRGDSSKELSNGGPFRDRTHSGPNGGTLGDIVNGSPIKGTSSGGGYDRLPSGAAGRAEYSAYRPSTSQFTLKNMRETVFVGANDGMLHAFNINDGTERFAFVPNAVYNARAPSSAASSPIFETKLKMLSQPGYAHRYTVDGPSQIGDAFIGPAGTEAWTTVLLGSTGAGARAVFALDIREPAVTTGGFDRTKAMWEFAEGSDASGRPNNLGFVLSYPHVARMRTGQWVAIFGNGYDSAEGVAKLFILDLKTGTVVWEKEVGTRGGNGLSQPNFMLNSNREVIAIYAGDLKGNLWKFDVSDSQSPANWRVAFGTAAEPQPLFSTDADPTISARQPITVMPELSFDAGRAGTWVSFGTGKTFETEDTDPSSSVNVNLRKVQAIYGIWDKPGETTGFAGVANLVQQGASTIATATDASANLSGTTNTTIDWSTKRGWYLNLRAGGLGERITVNPQQAKSMLLVLANTPDPEPCNTGGTSRLFVLDPTTGAAPAIGVLDSNGDRKIDTTDRGYNVKSFGYAVLSLPLLETTRTQAESMGTDKDGSRGQTGVQLGGVESGKILPPTDCQQWLLAGGSDTSVAGFDITLCSNNKPRISWRQLK